MTSVGVLYREPRVLLNTPNWVASTHTLHARKLNKCSSHLFKTRSDCINFRKESWIKPHLNSYHLGGELGKPENKFSHQSVLQCTQNMFFPLKPLPAEKL